MKTKETDSKESEVNCDNMARANSFYCSQEVGVLNLF